MDELIGWEGEAPAEPKCMVCIEGISAKARLVCWTNPTSSVLTPVICDLRIRVCDAVVATLRLGRSVALGRLCQCSHAERLMAATNAGSSRTGSKSGSSATISR